MDFVKGDSIELEITANTDITDWKIRCEIFDRSGGSVKLATANTGGSVNQIEIIDAENGIFLIKSPAGGTSNFEDEGFIEIEREDTNGNILTIYQGSIKFLKQQINWSLPS